MLTSSILTGFTTGAGLIVCIGSQNAYVLRQGLLRSHIGTVAAVCILSDVALIVAGIAGLGFLIDTFPNLFVLVRYAGALFLGVNCLLAATRAWKGSEGLTPATQAKQSRIKILMTSLAYTWLNPHVYIDTVFMLGSLSLHYSEGERWYFGFGAISASVLWFLSISYGAKLLQPLFTNQTAWRVLDLLIALLMGYFCITLLLIN
ncbi:LysE/ArgO family amino acid transporter [Vibrio sp.]|uniref:Amino acid transporter n=1 Tax=Vibrio viridaestus TaxID=2487322 RepID=A0A3N9U074_9VIBR|nr:LysE/ArgO family amino acid transporter [Vibrio viridaestus]MDC0610850.1 LysE/ArgO family amino acid transporter [Vibrio sp.]RQW62632.1 amino acid transporter [Vibrio viridaestus]